MASYKVYAIGNFEVHNFAPHWQGINLAFEELGYDYKSIDYRMEGKDRVIEEAKQFNPDFIIICIYDPLNIEGFVESIKNQTGAKIALWYCDYAEPTDYLGRGNKFRKTEGLDNIFISNRHQLEFYKNTLGTKAYFLPQGCLPLKKLPNKDKELASDIIFIGSMTGDPVHHRRIDLVNKINERRFLTIYPSNNRSPHWVYPRLPDLYRSSKVALSLSAFNDKDLYTSNRLFLVMGNGGFPLVERYKGMEDMWKIGEHLAVWNNVEDCIKKIDYYLTHKKEREEIRMNSFKYIQSKHTYIHRIKNMMDILQNKTERFYGYL